MRRIKTIEPRYDLLMPNHQDFADGIIGRYIRYTGNFLGYMSFVYKDRGNPAFRQNNYFREITSNIQTQIRLLQEKENSAVLSRQSTILHLQKVLNSQIYSINHYYTEILQQFLSLQNSGLSRLVLPSGSVQRRMRFLTSPDMVLRNEDRSLPADLQNFLYRERIDESGHYEEIRKASEQILNQLKLPEINLSGSSEAVEIQNDESFQADRKDFQRKSRFILLPMRLDSLNMIYRNAHKTSDIRTLKEESRTGSVTEISDISYRLLKEQIEKQGRKFRERLDFVWTNIYRYNLLSRLERISNKGSNIVLNPYSPYNLGLLDENAKTTEVLAFTKERNIAEAVIPSWVYRSDEDSDGAMGTSRNFGNYNLSKLGFRGMGARASRIADSIAKGRAAWRIPVNLESRSLQWFFKSIGYLAALNENKADMLRREFRLLEDLFRENREWELGAEARDDEPSTYDFDRVERKSRDMKSSIARGQFLIQDAVIQSHLLFILDSISRYHKYTKRMKEMYKNPDVENQRFGSRILPHLTFIENKLAEYKSVTESSEKDSVKDRDNFRDLKTIVRQLKGDTTENYEYRSYSNAYLFSLGMPQYYRFSAFNKIVKALGELGEAREIEKKTLFGREELLKRINNIWRVETGETGKKMLTEQAYLVKRQQYRYRKPGTRDAEIHDNSHTDEMVVQKLYRRKRVKETEVDSELKYSIKNIQDEIGNIKSEVSQTRDAMPELSRIVEKVYIEIEKRLLQERKRRGL